MVQNANAVDVIEQFIPQGKIEKVALKKMDVLAVPQILVGDIDRVAEIDPDDFRAEVLQDVDVSSRSGRRPG
jgi:hypothetical protein